MLRGLGGWLSGTVVCMHSLSIAGLCALDRVPAEPLYIKEYKYSLIDERSIFDRSFRRNNGNIGSFRYQIRLWGQRCVRGIFMCMHVGVKATRPSVHFAAHDI